MGRRGAPLLLFSLLPALPGRRFYFHKRRLRPDALYTDAMSASPPGRVGIVIFDPEDGVSYTPPDGPSTWRFASAPVSADLLATFREREQYVGQLEVLAAVAAYTSRPEQLKGLSLIHI